MVTVPVELTEHRKAEIADTLLGIRENIAELEEQKKASAAEFKEKIDAKETKSSYWFKTLKRGTEDQEMECTIVKNFDEGLKQYKDKNGVVVYSTPLTADDHVLALDDEVVGEVPDKIPEAVEEETEEEEF